MKRIVKLTLEIDASEYNGLEDTVEGVVELAIAMVRGETDFPEKILISSEDDAGSYEEEFFIEE